MKSGLSAHRLVTVVAGFSILAGLFPLPSIAQAPALQAWLFLRPHCASPQSISPDISGGTLGDILKTSPDKCINFSIRDPQTQGTPVLNVGDVLDMDLMLFNPGHAAINSVHAGLSYDPQVLDGISIELSSSLPVPTPGQQDFSPEEGVAKIAGSANPGGEPINGILQVARVQFMVKRHPRASVTPIGFDDVQPGILQGRTQITALSSGEERNIISPELGSLVVQIAEPPPASSAPARASSASAGTQTSAPQTSSLGQSSSSQSSFVPDDRSSFVLLQVQNVRAGTDGGTISVTWDALNSAGTSGYNIYYGTEKGRYIQRHSVTADSLSHVIRGLPVNVVYYLAVRAFNSSNEESAFSREVMIKTGDPSSSTAPLTLQNTGPNGQNPLQGNVNGSVPGQSGVPGSALIVIVCAALIGTAFAFRRQFSASRASR